MQREKKQELKEIYMKLYPDRDVKEVENKANNEAEKMFPPIKKHFNDKGELYPGRESVVEKYQ